MQSNQCVTCDNFLGDGVCTAYPDGIPVAIITGQADHTKPYEGDHGILWKRARLPGDVTKSACAQLNDVDAITYGEPTEHHKNLMSAPTPLFTVEADELPNFPPPANTGLITRIELTQINRIQNQEDIDAIFAGRADRDPEGLFRQYAEENGLLYDEKYFSELIRQTNAIVLRLKYKYNRPRPRQLANLHGVRLPGLVDTETAMSPAYPSGHSAISHLVALVLSTLYPRHAANFLEIGARIGISRVEGGVHFMSDHNFGRRIAEILRNYLRVEASSGSSDLIVRGQDVIR